MTQHAQELRPRSESGIHLVTVLSESGALRAEANGMWFAPFDRAPVDLSRRPALMRVFRVLLAARRETPVVALSVEELAKRAWWGERIVPRAAAARVYTSIRTLRKLGLRDSLVTREGGYLLHPAVPLVITAGEHTEAERR